MLFNSAEYATLVLVAAALGWWLRDKPTPRGLVLIGLSLLFYVRWNFGHPARFIDPEGYSFVEMAAVCLGLILLASVVDYLAGNRIASETRPRRRKTLVAASVALNLGILATFKYFNFFTVELGQLLGWKGPTLGLLAPMGISFYTFQTISYVVDVYRGKTAPAKRYQDYLLYLAFFPQLVMGPIVRAHELLPQIEGRPRLTAEQGSRAILRIGLGLVKKLVIADFLRAQIVDPVFTNPEMYSSVEALAAIYAYAFQIYADFSGYTDIAIGTAALMGFEIPENFKAPYIAKNLREFWQRWHITLSRWLRDYLYIPLGGSRCASWRIYLNLMITMVLGGLWHGASLNFVVWGGIHGLALGLTRAAQRSRVVEAIPGKVRSGVGLFLTFHVVTVAWVFFRAPTFDLASRVLGAAAAFDFGVDNLPVFVPVVLALAVGAHVVPERLMERVHGLFHRLPAPIQAALFIAMVLGAERVASTGVSPFIYSQF